MHEMSSEVEKAYKCASVAVDETVGGNDAKSDMCSLTAAAVSAVDDSDGKSETCSLTAAAVPAVDDFFGVDHASGENCNANDTLSNAAKLCTLQIIVVS